MLFGLVRNGRREEDWEGVVRGDLNGVQYVLMPKVADSEVIN